MQQFTEIEKAFVMLQSIRSNSGRWEIWLWTAAKIRLQLYHTWWRVWTALCVLGNFVLSTINNFACLQFSVHINII